MVALAATFAIPGSLDTPTGGYAYDRRIIAELMELGWSVDVLDLGEGFPDPTPRVRAQAAEALSGHRGSGPLVIDGLALGVLPETAVALQGKRPVVALVHHPLALETGVAPTRAQALRLSERAALAAVRRVVVTSETTAGVLCTQYGVSRADITVAPPGTDRAERATGTRADAGGHRSIALLAVGSLVPRKGYDILLAALAPLRALDWHLTIVGALDRSPATAKAIVEQRQELGLDAKVTLSGTLSAAALAERYAGSDIFVLASRFEGYGMAFAEAVMRGLPVIAAATGAIPATVPQGAGLLVPPDDVEALSNALRVALTDTVKRQQWADAAWDAGARLPTWQATGATFASALRAAI